MCNIIEHLGGFRLLEIDCNVDIGELLEDGSGIILICVSYEAFLHNLAEEVLSSKAHRAADSGGVMRLSVILQLNSLLD